MKKLVLATLLFSLFLSVPAFAQADGTMTLKDSVVAAVKQHPKIKAMLHNRDAVSKAQLSALGRFFPSLDLQLKLVGRNTAVLLPVHQCGQTYPHSH